MHMQIYTCHQWRVLLVHPSTWLQGLYIMYELRCFNTLNAITFIKHEHTAHVIVFLFISGPNSPYFNTFNAFTSIEQTARVIVFSISGPSTITSNKPTALGRWMRWKNSWVQIDTCILKKLPLGDGFCTHWQVTSAVQWQNINNFRYYENICMPVIHLSASKDCIDKISRTDGAVIKHSVQWHIDPGHVALSIIIGKSNYPHQFSICQCLWGLFCCCRTSLPGIRYRIRYLGLL